jgi:hypothetical protein
MDNMSIEKFERCPTGSFVFGRRVTLDSVDHPLIQECSSCLPDQFKKLFMRLLFKATFEH